jgi:hypothetical protein
MVDRLVVDTKAQGRGFPAGRELFKMGTRLAEERRELAAEVQRWEGEPLKLEKLGPPDRGQMAKEIISSSWPDLYLASASGAITPCRPCL